MKRKRIGLIAFLKGSTNLDESIPGCANYDHYKGGCLYNTVCLVQEGKRCKHFEKVVLPAAVDIGQRELLYNLYAKAVGVEIDPQNENVRKCPDCGAELKARKRYCDACSKKRRLQCYRKSRSKRNS